MEEAGERLLADLQGIGLAPPGNDTRDTPAQGSERVAFRVLRHGGQGPEDPGTKARSQYADFLWRQAASQFRSERRRIFRAYLRALDRDFSRVCAGLRAVVATADEDRSDLAILVARQQFAFRMAVVKTEFRLAMHAAGIGAVDTAQLLSCFDSLRVELRQVTGVTVGAAA